MPGNIHPDGRLFSLEKEYIRQLRQMEEIGLSTYLSRKTYRKLQEKLKDIQIKILKYEKRMGAIKNTPHTPFICYGIRAISSSDL